MPCVEWQAVADAGHGKWLQGAGRPAGVFFGFGANFRYHAVVLLS